MLDKVKLALRISNTAYDEEIDDLIEGAKADLVLSGVTEAKAEDVEDPLIKRVVITYCKANFGLSNTDSEKLQQSYEMIKNHLCLSVEYNGGDISAV